MAGGLIRRRTLRALFWIAVVVSYAAAVVPSSDAPDPTGWDKANHMLAFATMAVLAGPAFPGAPLWRPAVGLVAFGGLIELTQMIPALGRDAELADWIADAVAVAAGLAVSRAVPWPRLPP